jgi:hypothetical protein
MPKVVAKSMRNIQAVDLRVSKEPLTISMSDIIANRANHEFRRLVGCLHALFYSS